MKDRFIGISTFQEKRVPEKLPEKPREIPKLRKPEVMKRHIKKSGK